MQKPVPISDFPGISVDTIAIFLHKGMKASKDIFHLGINPDNSSALSHKLGIAGNELLELNSLCHLVRINGIGPAAARALYEGGHKSVQEISNAKPADLLRSINSINAEKQYYKANLGIKDMQFIIDAANVLTG